MPPASWRPRTPTSCCATHSAAVIGIASTRPARSAPSRPRCRDDGAVPAKRRRRSTHRPPAGHRRAVVGLATAGRTRRSGRTTDRHTPTAGRGPPRVCRGGRMAGRRRVGGRPGGEAQALHLSQPVPPTAAAHPVPRPPTSHQRPGLQIVEPRPPAPSPTLACALTSMSSRAPAVPPGRPPRGPTSVAARPRCRAAPRTPTRLAGRPRSEPRCRDGMGHCRQPRPSTRRRPRRPIPRPVASARHCRPSFGGVGVDRATSRRTRPPALGRAGRRRPGRMGHPGAVQATWRLPRRAAVRARLRSGRFRRRRPMAGSRADPDARRRPTDRPRARGPAASLLAAESAGPLRRDVGGLARRATRCLRQDATR